MKVLGFDEGTIRRDGKYLATPEHERPARRTKPRKCPSLELAFSLFGDVIAKLPCKALCPRDVPDTALLVARSLDFHGPTEATF